MNITAFPATVNEFSLPEAKPFLTRVVAPIIFRSYRHEENRVANFRSLSILTMMIRKKAAMYLLLMLGILPVYAADAPKGPLASNSAFPLYLPFIDVLPESAAMLGQNRSRLIVSSNYASTCINDPEILIPDFFALIDSETWILSLDANYGFFPFLDIGIRSSFTASYGGIFDPLISGFHALFGFPDGSRGSVDYNRYALFLKKGSDVWYNENQALAGIGNITIRAKISLVALPESRFFLSFQTAVKIPLLPSGTFLSSGRADESAALLVDFAFWHMAFYGNFGYILLGQAQNIPAAYFQRHLFSFVSCLEYIVSPEWSLYLQADGTTSAYNIDEYMVGDFSANFYFGFKLKFTENTSMQVAVSEEFFNFSTTDVGLVVAYCIETP